MSELSQFSRKKMGSDCKELAFGWYVSSCKEPLCSKFGQKVKALHPRSDQVDAAIV